LVIAFKELFEIEQFCPASLLGRFCCVLEFHKILDISESFALPGADDGLPWIVYSIIDGCLMCAAGDLFDAVVCCRNCERIDHLQTWIKGRTK